MNPVTSRKFVECVRSSQSHRHILASKNEVSCAENFYNEC